MDGTKLEVYLGIPMPSIELFEKPDEKDKSRTVLYTVLAELCACSGKLEFHLGAGFVNPDIRLWGGEALEAVVADGIFPNRHLTHCEVLVVSTTVPISSYDDPSRTGDESYKIDVARALARLQFCKQVSGLLVISNLARVGAIELHHSVLVQDSNTLDFSEIPQMDGFSLQRAAKVAAQMGWPRLADLDIETVWRWVTKRHRMMEGFDGDTMSRALAAFSRLFERKTADEPMQLLWALVGLEACWLKRSTQHKH